MKLMVSMVALAGCLISQAAYAQASQPDDVVIMRRTIAKQTKPVLQLPGTNEPAGYYSWKTTPWKQTGVCGEVAPQTRDAWCESTTGTRVDDARCYGNGSGPKPVKEMQAVTTQTCEYQWRPGAWEGDIPSCGSVTQTRTMSCVTKNGQQTDSTRCMMKPPETTQTVANYAKCDFTWVAGQWATLQTFCGDVEQQRLVTCRASDGSTVADDYCAHSGPAPDSAYTIHFPKCSPDGTIDATKRGWMTSDWTTAPAQGCGTFVISRSAQCVTGAGAVVNDAECPSGKPETTDEIEVTSSCTYGWQYGPTSAAPAGCGVVNATRTVSCVRSDGKVMPGQVCNEADRPASAFPSTDYSKCGFKWEAGEWSDWSETCGESVRTRAVMCKRSDGQTVEDAKCSDERPASNEVSYVTTGCGIDWKPGAWVSESSCAEKTKQTREVKCVRSDGQEMPETSCSGSKPTAERVENDLSGCTYTWSAGQYGEPSTTCGKATVSRPVSCQRSDGKNVLDQNCGAAGEKPEASYEVEMATSCTYTWESSDWQDPVPACGATTHARVNTCTRSDGKAVAASYCTTPEPARGGPTEDFSTCTYQWYVSQWNNDGSCGDSAVQTRTVSCQRSEGSMVEAKFCTTPKPASTQTVTDYTGCKFEWNSVPGQWSSSCSTAATRTNTVTCRRSDGSTVGEEYCPAGSKPPVTETQEVLSQCSYVGTYENWSVCRSQTQGSLVGTQTGTLVSCRRSDNTVVANDKCQPSQTRECSVEADRFVREPYEIYDSSEMPTAIRQYNTPNAATLKLTVISTTCWDRQTSAITSNANCTNLPTGANVYDVVQIPATFLPEMREVYVNQADLSAVVPHGRAYGNNVSYICANPGQGYSRVQEAGGNNIYSLNCGVPDKPSNYVRAASQLGDTYGYAVTRDQNLDINATKVAFIVETTLCRDVSKNTNASTAKCAYLPTGANVYDVVSVPATYVQDLREIYIEVADLRAAMPYGGSIGGTTVADTSICTRNWGVRVGASRDTWTIRCGTPDSAQNYQRAAGALADPYEYSSLGTTYRNTNVDTATSLALTVSQTVCRNTTTSTNVTASKCTYLQQGANTYDLVNIPATYVPGLREVYVKQSDLEAALPYGGSTLGVTVASLCSTGRAINIGSGGSRLSYTLRCGAPDSTENYSHEVYSLGDPYDRSTSVGTEYRNMNFDVQATTMKYMVTNTVCIDKRTGASAASAKCQYLANGANVYDVVEVPTTKAAGLREFYVQKEDILAKAPYVATISGYLASGQNIGSANICNGNTRFIMQGSYWNMLCGAPDSEDNYVRRASTIGDPYGVTSKDAAYRQANYDLSASTFKFAVTNTTCVDRRTNAIAANTAKCQYLSGGDNANVNDVVEIPATKVTGLREFYIRKEDVLAAQPYVTMIGQYNGSNYGINSTSACNGSLTYIVQGANWKLRCGEADSDQNYERRITAIGDPYNETNKPIAYRYVNTSANPRMTFIVANTACYDKRTNAVAAESTKCSFIAGPNKYDTFDIGATYVDDLREIYFDKQELLQKVPQLSNFYSSGTTSNPTNMCNGNVQMNTGQGANRYNYRAYCDRPADSGSNYTKTGTAYADPYTYYSGTRFTNATNGSLTYTVASLGCYDNRTGSPVSNKCDYLPGLKVYDRFTVPGTWDLTAKTITISLAAVKAQQSPYSPSSAFGASYMCNANYQTTSGAMKVICQP